MIIKQKIRTFSLLPYIMTAVMVFQVVFQHYVLDNIQYYISIIIIMFMLFLNSRDHAFKVRINLPLYIIVLILGFVFLAPFLLPSMYIGIIGSLSYLLPLIFWYLYLNYDINNFDMIRYLQFVIMMGGIVSLIGIYQRFVDPTIFGIMNRLSDYYTAVRLTDSSVFRVSSIMSSTQTYSLFLGICTALLIELWSDIAIRNVFIKMTVLSILLIGGIIGGGRVFFLVAIFPFISLIIKKLKCLRTRVKIQSVQMMIIFVVFMSIIIIINLQRVGGLMEGMIVSLNRIRAVNRSSFVSGELSRISAMMKVYTNNLIYIIFGRGLGTSSYAAYSFLGGTYKFERVTVESYALAWMYEMGVIGLIAFICLFGNSLYIAFKYKSTIRWTVLGCFLSMIISPAFYNNSLLPVWVVFIIQFYAHFNDRNYLSEKVKSENGSSYFIMN